MTSPSRDQALAAEAVAQRAATLYREHRDGVLRRVDRMFAALMVGQWIFGILVAVFFSPYGWAGKVRSVHFHVYVAVFLGAALSSFPVALAILRPGRASTRQVIAAAQMLWSALLIHLSGGRIETHFHVFGSLAFLSFYRDWRVLPTATLVVVIDHLFRGIVWPESVYGLANPEWWRFLEHGFWVLFCDTFLILACINGTREMKEIAERRAEAEELSKTLELRVEERTAQLAEAQELAYVGSWDWVIATHRMTWSSEFYRMVGLDAEQVEATYDAFLDCVHPEDRESVSRAIDTALRDRRPFDMEHRIVRPNGEVRILQARGRVLMDATGRAVRMVGTGQDITERKRAEEARAQQARELARSNAELEQFAYVASHDLQEPLRMISSYTQLLARRYHDRLDADAGQFITYAVDGASRMQALINDLLLYSRVGSQQKELRPTDCQMVLDGALTNLRVALAESDAVVTRDQLPVVLGDEVQLGQLFENLVRNAIKFRTEKRRPEVHLGVRREGANWVFTVRDNGIGIDPADAERVFVIFQRLHSREYAGTGIGLAICKKIVERHGGRIWVESEPGKGATFCFTIPLRSGLEGFQSPPPYEERASA